jgi:hypothetical protein
MIIQARIARAESELREMDDGEEEETAALTEAAENHAAVKAEVEETIREANQRLSTALTAMNAANAARRRHAQDRDEKRAELSSLRAELNAELGLEEELVPKPTGGHIIAGQRKSVQEQVAEARERLAATQEEAHNLQARRNEIERLLAEGREDGEELTDHRVEEMRDEVAAIQRELTGLGGSISAQAGNLSELERRVRQGLL